MPSKKIPQVRWLESLTPEHPEKKGNALALVDMRRPPCTTCATMQICKRGRTSNSPCGRCSRLKIPCSLVQVPVIMPPFSGASPETYEIEWDPNNSTQGVCNTPTAHYTQETDEQGGFFEYTGFVESAARNGAFEGEVGVLDYAVNLYSSSSPSSSTTTYVDEMREDRLILDVPTQAEILAQMRLRLCQIELCIVHAAPDIRQQVGHLTASLGHKIGTLELMWKGD
ncbi:hypothetical protein B0H11DRAFT_2076431 [Mycena galericulata]|nr:hypothetical protein B0H11DRAFT_2076431 [Mycena galericulata]